MSIFQKYILIAVAILSSQSTIFSEQNTQQEVFDFACQLEKTGSEHHILVSWLKKEAFTICCDSMSGLYPSFIIINSSNLDQKEKIAALIDLMVDLKQKREDSQKEHEEWQKEQDAKYAKQQEESRKQEKRALVIGAIAMLTITPIIAFAGSFCSEAGQIFAQKMFKA